MRFESFRRELDARIEHAFVLSTQDAARFSAAQRGSPSDTRAEQLGRLRARIGSSKPYALAQERGAYIVPRRGRVGRNGRPPALRLHNGTYTKRVRLPARRWLAKAGRAWDSLFTQRLRETGGR